MTEIPISLPLDADGFLRRECPTCIQQFKWHHGKTEDAPDDFVYADVYWCPLCGESAGHESWWTPAQLAYAREAAMPSIHDELGDLLGDAFKPAANSFIKFEVSRSDRPESPDPLVEDDDMVMIAPPCHPWEPVKVPTEANARFYCLVCGQPYAV